MIAGVIPFTSEYRLLGEYAVNKNQAAQLGFSYLGKSPILSAIESSGPAVNNVLNQKLKVRGYRIQASYKFYLTQLSNGYNKSEFLAPQGLYFAPLVSYSSAKMYMRYFQVNDIWIRATHFNANLLIGGQAFLGNLALDVFFGLGYKKNQWLERYTVSQIILVDMNDLPSTYSGRVKVSLGFNIGYGF